MSKNRIPKIRFPEFIDAWEQRKLSDVTESIKNGYTYKADGSRDHRYKITRIESISSGVINTEKLGSSDEVNEDYRLKDGDILFSHINSLPYIANTALYTADLGEIYHGMNLLNIRSKQAEIDSHFLLHLLKKESTRDWFRIIAKPAVNQASISTTEVGSFEFLMPKMDEQKKISLVLDNLDNLITLHQRKCDKIKEYKKGCLQKMFPKDGADVPEIRFPGFTDAWEQRKLSEITSLITKGTTPKDKSGDGEINFIKVENIDSSSGEIKACSKISIEEHEGYLKRSQLKENDILFSIAGTLGRTTVVNKGLLPANTNQALAILRMSEGDISYIVTVLKGRAVSDFVRKNPTVGAQPNLSLEQVSNLEIPYPNIDEQAKIGSFFRDIDNLITLHQRECEKYKELKKGLLQQMFA